MSFTLPIISALGTSWWIEVFEDISAERCQIIHDDCAAFLHSFEKQYSRFAPNSFITILNEQRELVEPTQELITLLQFGIDQYERTDGIFSIMVGSALVELGYDAQYSFTPSQAKTSLVPPHEALDITPGKITLHHGLVDIGGFGKGFAIDGLASLLVKKHHLQYFLINGGGDMYGTTNQGNPIEIYLEHPTEKDSFLTTTTLQNQGFAASSPHKRAWQFNGTTYSHIIDTVRVTMRTRPDATFIKASSACTADIFATVALIASPEKMEKFAAHEQIGVASFTTLDSTFIHNHEFLPAGN